MLLIASICAGAARAILTLFGPGFARAAPAFVLLIAYPAVSAVTSAQTQALWSVNRPGLTSFTALGRLALTITLTVLLTPRIGIIGPAIGLLAGFLLDLVCKTVALRPFLSRSLRLTWPVRERLALVVSYVCGFGVARELERSLPSLGGLLLSLAAATVAYTGALLLSGGVNDRDRGRLSELLALVRSRRGRASAAGIEGTELAPGSCERQAIAHDAPGNGAAVVESLTIR